MKRLSMGWKIFILAAFNFIDLVTTLWVLGAGVARELNPLMRWAYEISPAAFGGLKAALFMGSTALLWRNRDQCRAHRAAWVAMILFGALSVYQLISIGYLLKVGALP